MCGKSLRLNIVYFGLDSNLDDIRKLYLEKYVEIFHSL